MDAVLDGLRQLFWHPSERRLRAPLRIGVTLLVALLMLLALGATASLLGSVVGTTGPAGAAVGDAVFVGAGLVLFLGIVRLVDRRYVRDLGLDPTRRWLADLGVGLLVGAAMAAATVLAALAAGLAAVEGVFVTREGDMLAGLSVPAGVALGFVLSFLLAALEEVLFRGYLLVNVAEGLRGIADDRTAVGVGVAVTAGLFGLAHALNPGASPLSVLNITLFGLLLGAAYALTGRLALPIGVHVTWNVTVGSVFGLPVSGLTTGATLLAVEADGATLLTGGDFGPEGGLLALAGFAVGVGALAWWIRRSTGGLGVAERIVEPDLLAGDPPRS